MLRLILRNISWLTIASIVQKLVFVIVGILVARMFTEEVYGQFAHAFSFVAIVGIFINFGVSNYMIRAVARDRSRASRLLSTGLLIKLVALIFVIPVLGLVTIFDGSSFETDLLIYIFTIYVVFSAFNKTSLAVFRAYERMGYEAVLKLVEGMFALAGVAIAGYFLDSVYMVTAAISVAAFIAFIFSIFFLRNSFMQVQFRTTWHEIKAMLQGSWPFALADVFVVLYFNVDTLMVSYMKGEIQTAWYGAAYFFVTGALMLPQMINGALYPRFSASLKENSIMTTSMRRYLTGLLLVALLVSAFLFLFSKELTVFFYGSEYIQSAAAVAMLSLAIPFLYYASFMGTFFSSVGRQRQNLLVTGIGLSVNVGLNLVLIPTYGYIGAAVASVAATMVFALVIMIYYAYYKHQQAPR